jgi:quercetin dioxygenase-like cupin family protein
MIDRRIVYSSGLSLLLILVFVACPPTQSTVKPVELSYAQPSATTAPSQPAIFHLKDLKWEEGKGTLAGVKVFVVYEDPVSGAKALFLKVPGKKIPDPRLHYHTDTAHSFIIEGTITSGVGDKTIAVNPGDYFRAPAGWDHKDSGCDIGFDGTIFMIIEGRPKDKGPARFDTVNIEADQATKRPIVEPNVTTKPSEPALFHMNELRWQEGVGSYKGVNIAVVHEDPVTGAKAMFLKVPANKAPDSLPHYHSDRAHSYIIEGNVGSGVGGNVLTGTAGDYFRGPANWVHKDSHSDTGALIFMIIEGRLDGNVPATFDTMSAPK